MIQIPKERKKHILVGQFQVLFKHAASLNGPPLSCNYKLRMPNYFTKLQMASINLTHVHCLSMYNLQRSLYLIRHLGNYFYGNCHIGVVHWFLDNMINLLQVRLQLFGQVHHMIIQQTKASCLYKFIEFHPQNDCTKCKTQMAEGYYQICL